MKTIEEAAYEYACKVNEIWQSSVIATRSEAAFKSGVEFAQRWIPVEEELPIKFKKDDTINEVLIKTAEEYINLGWYDSDMKSFNSAHSDYEILNVTHWRPIELK